MIINATLVLLLQVASPGASCGTGNEIWPTKKWQVSTPETLGFHADSVAALVQRARAMPAVTSLLVVRHGQVAVEEYFHGGGRGQAVPVASVTKSVTSFLVGIAIARGLIDSLDEPVIKVRPQIAPPPGRVSAGITIRQLLTMTSGLRDDWYVEKPLMLRIMARPGAGFRYSNEGVQVLVGAISTAAGENVLKFSRATLWKPLDIDVNESRWPTLDVNGNADGAGGLRLTSRELAKLGLLTLRDGCWDGTQVVPAAYVAEATRKQVDAGIPVPDGRGYGFLFWITPGGVPYMAGYGGQFVVVRKDLDLVAIITASLDVPDHDEGAQLQLVTEGVASAVR